jgi:retinol dehydrogenase-12
VCYALDLSVFASVLTFAEEFGRVEGRLDILLHSAGVSDQEYKSTADGWEAKCVCFLHGTFGVDKDHTSLQVNFLSLALLAVLLFPIILETSAANASALHRPRIIFVTSELHFWLKSAPELLASANMLTQLNDAEYNSSRTVMRNRYFVTKRAFPCLGPRGPV